MCLGLPWAKGKEFAMPPNSYKEIVTLIVIFGRWDLQEIGYIMKVKTLSRESVTL